MPYINFSHKRLSKLLSNRLRLAILCSLAHSEESDFTSLKHAVKSTDGNMSIQLGILEKENLIVVNKIMHQNRPQTNLALSNKGRLALQEFKETLTNWFEFE